MKLVAEQVKNICEEIKKEEEYLKERKAYLEKINEELMDAETRLRNGNDTATIDNFNMQKKKLEEYKKVLATSELIKKVSTDQIGIGTKFSLKFSDNDEIEHFILLEDPIGTKVSSPEEHITVKSPIGKMLLGKKVNDTIEYSAEPSSNEKIEITIVDIKTNPEEYPQYIHSQPAQDRICRKEKLQKRQLAKQAKLDPQKKEQQDQSYAITESQEMILRLEALRLINSLRSPDCDKKYAYLRLGKIRKVLSTQKIASLPTDGTIGIGTHFSLMLFTPEKTTIRRVEMINQAMGEELKSDYIEKISLLGTTIFGLKENEEFIAVGSHGKYLTGKVFDIDNQKTTQKTTDPLVYQKYIKRGKTY